MRAQHVFDVYLLGCQDSALRVSTNLLCDSQPLVCQSQHIGVGSVWGLIGVPLAPDRMNLKCSAVRARRGLIQIGGSTARRAVAQNDSAGPAFALGMAWPSRVQHMWGARANMHNRRMIILGLAARII